MAKFLALFIFFFIIPAANSVCTIPSEGMEIKEAAVLCPGAYRIESGIKINADNVSLDCSNSALAGNGIGYGILVKGKNALIKNCNISNYEIGVYIDSANSSIVKNNSMHGNKFGIALFNSFDSDISGNILADNMASDSIAYFLDSQIGKEAEIPKEEKLPTPQDVMEEVIKIKNPDLDEDRVKQEVDAILGKYFNLTEKNLEITRTILFNDNDGSTTIVLSLKPKKALLNVSIYEKIPKCVSSYVDKILFETLGYEVIKEDPLVLWSFARVDNEKKIVYKILKSIDEECKSLLFAFGIASGFQEFEKAEIKKEKNKGYLAGAIIIIVLILIVAAYGLRKKSP